jgi:competence protein ComEC
MKNLSNKPAVRALLATLVIALALFGCASATPDAEDSPSEQAAPAATAPVNAPNTARILPGPLEEVLPSKDGFALLYVNVGKADAAILRIGDKTVLIDTGSAESAPQLIAGLNALNVTAIDAVFITHSHGDHLGGLDALAANYSISTVYSPFYSEPDKNGVSKIVKRAEKLNLAHRELQAGESISVADGVSFDVLGPLSLNKEDDNDNSLVLRFSYYNKTFLFTGDMQFAEEQAIIESGADLRADVLKVGNHGNPDATGDDFAARVSPSYAIISTNTQEDPDSANARVAAALARSMIFLTQDFPIGLLVTFDGPDTMLLSNPARGDSSLDVSIQSIDMGQQTVTLENNGSSDANLSGCTLYSKRSDALLRFPEGTILPAGQTLTIGTGKDFSFPNEDKPLSKKKANTVTFYDSYGARHSQYEQ